MSEPGRVQRIRTHVRERREALVQRLVTSREEARTGLLRRGVSATRARVLAEAVVLLLLGFTADDLRLLVYPGWIIAGTLAFLHVLLGGLWYGRRIEADLRDEDPDRIDDHLEGVRTRGRLYAIAAGALLIGWLIFFSAGVPPWAL